MIDEKEITPASEDGPHISTLPLEFKASHPVTLGGVTMDLRDFKGVMGLEQRKGFDCLLSNGARIVLNNQAEIDAMTKTGNLIYSTPRSGFDIVFKNGQRLAIAEEEKAEYERVLEWSRATEHVYDMLMSNINGSK
jgi:hypothetical protein